MFAVVFEVEPRPEHWEEYLAIARELRPELERIEGFVENRRFHSYRRPGWLLSLSLWRDEAAVIRWRSHAAHRLAQLRGRAEIFRDYHLRVGEVLDKGDGSAAPRTLCLVEQPQEESPPPGWGEWDLFSGLLDPGDRLMLLGQGEGRAAPARGSGRQLWVRIVRDYAMRSRAEAPQEMPPAPPP
jgi:heme-degrading monooxygenase HmoA